MITHQLVGDFREDLGFRRISKGLARLEAHRHLIDCIRPGQPNAGILLGAVAQWVDIGFADQRFLAELVNRFAESGRSGLVLVDYVRLRMAEGLLATYAEDRHGALRHFQMVLSLADETSNQVDAAVAQFWMARCLRQSGAYDEAEVAAQAASRLAREIGYEPMAAVMWILESWIKFQKGHIAEALHILRDAEQVISGTDDHVSLGNIFSAYGRIARREGKYDQSLHEFQRAIAEYRKRDEQHPSLARVLANIALVERLCAQQVQRKLDCEAARRSSAQRGSEKRRLAELQSSAMRHLETSQQIYQSRRSSRGEGMVHSIRGNILLDRGELDGAQLESARAYELGSDKQDSILMARGRILQCMVECARVEEGVYEENPEQHARLAYQYALDALNIANATQDVRLIARAYIWKGLTLCNELFHDLAASRECYDRAAALIRPGGHDYIWDELQELRSRMIGDASIDFRLREWSQGHVHAKTFQQLQEEFAEIVIPQVWEREERRISRVAARLSVSPKKVRRILSHLGLLDSGNGIPTE